MLHGFLIHGWEVQTARMSFVWVGWMAVANLVGAAVYVARVGNTFLSLISGC
jgi:adiponectin receptor